MSSRPPQQHVLVCSRPSLADGLRTWPLLQALSHGDFPRRLTWLAGPDLTGMIQGVKGIDFVPWPPRQSLSSWGGLLQKLRRQQYHVVVDTCGQWTSKVLQQLLSGPTWCRIDDASVGHRQGFSKATLSALDAAGLSSRGPARPTRWSAGAVRAIRRFIRDTHLSCGYLAVHVGRLGPEYGWSARDYGSVLRSLGRKWRLPSLLIYHGEQQLQWAEAAATRSGGHALVAPTWNWQELGAAIQMSEALLAHDDAFLQLAVLSGTSSICLLPESGDDALPAAATDLAGDVLPVPRGEHGLTINQVVRACQTTLRNRPKVVDLVKAA